MAFFISFPMQGITFEGEIKGIMLRGNLGPLVLSFSTTWWSFNMAWISRQAHIADFQSCYSPQKEFVLQRAWLTWLISQIDSHTPGVAGGQKRELQPQLAQFRPCPPSPAVSSSASSSLGKWSYFDIKHTEVLGRLSNFWHT